MTASYGKPYSVSWCQVDWSDDAQDPADYMEGMRFDDLDEARAFAAATSKNWGQATVYQHGIEQHDGAPLCDEIASYVDGELES